jgi:four helix bundle protein
LPDLKDRTKKYSIRVIRFYKSLSSAFEVQHIGRQFLRSGTSVGANTRAAFRARSKKEYLAKLGIVVEEADECIYGAEILDEFLDTDKHDLLELKQEAEELISIFVSLIKNERN